jgi:pimeloyl-ACP methyl ester carboxylesterase
MRCWVYETRVALIAICAATALAGTSSPVAAQLRDVQTTQLTATDGTVFEMTNAFVRVPEQRTTGAAEGRTIDLAVVRIRRTGKPSSSAHVVLAGGPGDSGIDQVVGLARNGGAVLADLFNGDVIGIDQRGTGRSVPNLSSSALYHLPLDQPGSIEGWLPIIERVSREEAARLRTAGIALEAYNSRESADDVAAVCSALNYTSVTLWGRSYGSHLALATLGRYEKLVSRLVLVSPEGLDHTWKQPSTVDGVLRRLEAKGAGEIVRPLTLILERLRGAPVTVEVAHPQSGRLSRIVLGAFDIQWVVSQALGDPRSLRTLPGALREMAAGDFRRVAQIALLRRERSGVQSAMKMMMDISSGASPARQARIEREAQTAVLGNAINFPGMYLGNAWGAIDLGDDFRRQITSHVPALILVGDLDPRTPAENANEIAATLSRATLVTVENATHQFDLFGNAAIRDALKQFLGGEPMRSPRIAMPALVFQQP